MDDLEKLFTALGLPTDSRLMINRLDTLGWGHVLHFQCVALHPDADAADTLDAAHAETATPLTLHFDDCRELRWQLYTHALRVSETPFPRTEVINFSIGQSRHRKPALLLSDHFGLTVVYNTLEILNNDTTIRL
jgi:hypothetical protein